MPFILKWISWLGLLACLQACAQPLPIDLSRSPYVISSTPSLMPAPATPVTGFNQEGLTGQVVSASDVTGQPDSPLPDQIVLAVPMDKAGQVLGLPSANLTDQVLRFLAADLPQKDPAVASTVSDSAGNYVLVLAPGEYILCVADSEQTPPDFPATVRGCGRVQLMPGGLRRIDISRSFGEILLIER